MSSSTAMLPPPLSSRRRPRIQLPPSPPPSPDASPCRLRKMSLPKAETFHIPSTPPSDNDPVLSIAHLPRRSSTASKTLLALMLGKDEDVEDPIIAFEKKFSASKSPDNRRSDKGFRDISGRRHRERRTPLDIDGLNKEEKPSHEHASDSGLGTSISSIISCRQSGVHERESAAERLLLLGESNPASETDSRSLDSGINTTEGSSHSLAESLVVDPYFSGVAIDRKSCTRPSTRQSTASSAITRSISPLYTAQSPRSSLSSFARKKISDLVFAPILREETFELFHPLVHTLNEQNRKRSIKCLRDLEKSLIFEPLVGASDISETIYEAYAATLQRLTRSTNLFRRFGEFSVQLVLDTYPHLSEPEQRRSTDRPYDNGYFLDLVQQVNRLAAQIQSHRDSGETDESAPTMYVSPACLTLDYNSRPKSEDRITLEGGMADTGNVAELCRWKDGVPISLRTGEVYEPLAGTKRSSSDIDDDVERSMARRKKGALPLELRCSDKTCDKIFTRKCDLAKHEKTHSRPFKCAVADCKYHDLGLPTEKERDRHMNDKHSANPHFYHCLYCPFKTKRDSNCKQHMEKKHGWTYERVKGNGRVGVGSTTSGTPQQTPQTPAASTPVSLDYSSVRDGSTAPQSLLPTPIEPTNDAFHDYHYEAATPVHLGGSLFTPGRSASVNGSYNYASPNQQMTVATPYSAISNITEQHGTANEIDLYGNDQFYRTTGYNPYSMATPPSPDMKFKMAPNQYTNMPLTPSTTPDHPVSRNASVSLTTPLTDNNGLDQTISPEMPFEDDSFINFNSAPDMPSMPMDTSGFAGDIPMGDFSLFGSDGFMNPAAASADLFEKYLDFEGYEA